LIIDFKIINCAALKAKITYKCLALGEAPAKLKNNYVRLERPARDKHSWLFLPIYKLQGDFPFLFWCLEVWGIILFSIHSEMMQDNTWYWRDYIGIESTVSGIILYHFRLETGHVFGFFTLYPDDVGNAI